MKIKTFPSRRDSMILTAINIIDEVGFQGLSAQELATREGVAPSLIYRYYSSMDDIVAAVVDYYSQYDAAIIRSVYMKSQLSPREKVLDFLRSYVEYYENYPAVTALVNSYESLKHNPAAKMRMENIAEQRIKALEGLLRHAGFGVGEADGLTSKDLAITLWGYVMNLVFVWRLQKAGFSLKTMALSKVSLMLRVFEQAKDEGGVNNVKASHE